jgi:hypothetical protein
MQTRTLLLALLGLTSAFFISAAPANAQATRTWVSGVGDDVNPCSRTAPCKTFAGAISKTAAGGEINCLDPGGFGTVTITKSMTIDCIGTDGSILAAGTNGVNVNDSATATPGTIVVNLKNLSIQGAGSGLVGVNFTSGFSLHLDNVTIENFNSGTAAGVRFAPNNAGTRFLFVDNSFIWNNGIAPSTGGGILVTPTAAGALSVAVVNNTKVEFGAVGLKADGVTATVQLAVNDSQVSFNRGGGVLYNNGATGMVARTAVIGNSIVGVQSTGASFVRIHGSNITLNSTGVGGTGTLRSNLTNYIAGNGGGDGTPVATEGPH